MGKLDGVLLIKVTLCPLDKYNCFHPANCPSTFSKIALQIIFSLNYHPKESLNISLEASPTYNLRHPPTPQC